VKCLSRGIGVGVMMFDMKVKEDLVDMLWRMELINTECLYNHYIKVVNWFVYGRDV
jgi:hypothetical protein